MKRIFLSRMAGIAGDSNSWDSTKIESSYAQPIRKIRKIRGKKRRKFVVKKKKSR